MITHGLNIATTIRATRNIRIAAIATRLNANGSKKKEKLVGVMMISQIVSSVELLMNLDLTELKKRAI